MNRKITVGVAIAIALLCMTVTFTGTMIFSMRIFDNRMASVQAREAMYKKLSEIDQTVRSNAMGVIDDERLNDYLAAGYINGLEDRSSRYYSASEMSAVLSSQQGKVVGIGMEVEQKEDGYLTVKRVYPASPAQTGGITASDIITFINDVDILTVSYDEAVAMLEGSEGTTVKLKYLRESEENEIELIRRVVDIPSVDTYQSDSVGYISISEFNASTVQQASDAIDVHVTSGMSSIVFDLRDNSEGTLVSACEILDMVLPVGTIATASYNDGSSKVLYTSDENRLSIPIVVLVNEKTGGAAELFAAAIRDFKIGSIVGTTTGGKGTVQTLYTLSDGSGIEITTSKFYPPSGVSFDGKGLEPDYVVRLPEGYTFKQGYPDTANDTQYLKAVEVATALSK